MTRIARIALIGDYSDAVVAHRAIPVALQRSADALGVDISRRSSPL